MINAKTSRLVFPLVLTAVALLVAVTYWPVLHADFVWDDLLDFKRAAWLRHGNDWQHFLLHNFNNWSNYFRPLIIALFTAEVRTFDARPGPMHGVSLAIHVANSILVGVLATRLSKNDVPAVRKSQLFALSALLYGLHPLLVEPVVWIGCQFDLVATLFMLLGWTLNTYIANSWGRATSVAGCFFLAACSKESTLAFPLVLVVCDWMALKPQTRQTAIARFFALLKLQLRVYVCIAIAGVVYLSLRYWALEGVLFKSSDTMPLAGRLHEAAFLYLRYWRMFFWPMAGMSPVHSLDAQAFLHPDFFTWLKDGLALLLLAVGIVLTFRRSYTGALILSVTLALIPVLHLLAADFDSSPFHERYAITALAIACAWFPMIWTELPKSVYGSSVLSIAGHAILAVWLIIGIMNIRLTIPLWSSQVSLWQWALQEEPHSIVAKDQLLTAYIDNRNYDAAWHLVDQLAAEHSPCINCMLSASMLAIRQRDYSRASLLLDQVDAAGPMHGDMLRAYRITRAQLLLLQNNPAEAERIMRDTVSMDNLDPEPQITLAIALAMQGKTAEATQVEKAAIALLPPDQQQRRLDAFRRILKGNRQ